MKGFIEVTKQVWEGSDEYKEKFCSIEVQIDKNITDEKEIEKAIRKEVKHYRYENELTDITRTDFKYSKCIRDDGTYFVNLYSKFKILLNVNKIIRVYPSYDNFKKTQTTDIDFIRDSEYCGIRVLETYEEIKQKIKEAQGE